MGTKATGRVAGELAEVKRGFDQWRRSRSRGREIPEPLWRMAVKAATRYGVQSTARRLGLNSTRLQKQVQRLAPAQAAEDPCGFVELPWPGAASLAECILEAEDHAGRKLRIHLKGPATAQAACCGRVNDSGQRRHAHSGHDGPLVCVDLAEDRIIGLHELHVTFSIPLPVTATSSEDM